MPDLRVTIFLANIFEYLNLFNLFLGVYLPLLWEQSFCIRSPIALGYTRGKLFFLFLKFKINFCFLGHFSALVPSEPYQRLDSTREDEEDITFLPLMDCENKLIPIHFLTRAEVSDFLL